MRLSCLATLTPAMLMLAAATPAFAQKPADRAPTQVSGPNVEVIREAVNTLKVGGECMVEFSVGKDGKTKNLKPVCTPEAYTPDVVRAMETVEYLPEIFDGEIFETDGHKQPFRFAGPTVKPATIKQPVVVKNVEPKDISRAINKFDETGACQVTLTVGLDGKPKDIKPNCTPAKYDSMIADAVKKMVYQPAEKDGQQVEASVTIPLSLTKPD